MLKLPESIAKQSCYSIAISVANFEELFLIIQFLLYIITAVPNRWAGLVSRRQLTTGMRELPKLKK